MKQFEMFSYFATLYCVGINETDPMSYWYGKYNVFNNVK